MNRPVTLQTSLPTIRGKIIPEAMLADLTWLRVGGPAQFLVLPQDEDDLADFLAQLDRSIPVMPIGVGSNLLVRDGGLRGVVLRLGAGFGKVETDGLRVSAGAAALDATVAKVAARAGIAGLEFLRGVPGTIGGALRMNAGAYDGEVKDHLIEAVAFDRDGKRHVFSNAELNYTYRHCGLDDQFIFTQAVFEGVKGEPADIEARMNDIMARREASQPIREKTGGSTFKNPDPEISKGKKSWQLIDSVGGRGFRIGDAMFSQQHCNFLINTGGATAADIEAVGETIRDRVKRETRIELHWEIKRIGDVK